MPRNPNQLFTVGEISRTQIANDLNGQLSQPAVFTPDDDRLTDRICEQVADWLGENPVKFETCEEDWTEAYAEFLTELLIEMGIEVNA